MGKDLSEMALEELWELFPIFLVAHDDHWKDNFNEIEKTLTGLLANQPVVRISHIGSTAIQGIWAKNIVDVMVEVSQSADMRDFLDRVGAGDALSGGLIHALGKWDDMQKVIEFASAAGALKATIAGDMNSVTEEEVMDLAFSGQDGIRR